MTTIHPRILIKNARLINEGIITEGDILLEHGRIARIDSTLTPSDTHVQVIDAAGGYVMPGVIDSQVHFREPGLTHKGDIASESMAAIAGGVTSYIEQPNTVPQAVTVEELEKKYARAAEVSWANYSFNMGATNNNLEELKKISKRDVAGIKIFMGSSTGNMLVDNPETLERIFREVDHQLIAHCEDEATIQRNLQNILAKKGAAYLTAADHPIIRSAEGCYVSSSAAIAMARKTGARFHLYHVSTAQELELLEGDIPLSEKKITAEACVHHLWFSDEDYADKGNLIKWNPAIKTKDDRDALRAALLNGKIDVVSTDHAPHTLEEKMRPYIDAPSGGPLIQNSLPAMIELARRTDMDVARIVQLMCHNQADLFGIEERGYLREGYHADVVIVDPSRPWNVTRESILSKCGWSPFEGKTFAARVTHTFVNGHLVYRNGHVRGKAAGQRLMFLRG
ncbi:MAG TPA: dihydroorotase [Cryomorphaceae bacterium]|jgi:dihydroorotase|nr:dihydroorotase [Cryomorphaceae bacterium]